MVTVIFAEGIILLLDFLLFCNERMNVGIMARQRKKEKAICSWVIINLNAQMGGQRLKLVFSCFA